MKIGPSKLVPLVRSWKLPQWMKPTVTGTAAGGVVTAIGCLVARHLDSIVVRAVLGCCLMGVVLWAIGRFSSLPYVFKQLITIVACAMLIVWLFTLFGYVDIRIRE